MGKHQCTPATERVEFKGRSFEFHACVHCGRRFGLEWWQIMRMPPKMAKCADSPVRRTFWEWLTGRVDCRGAPL